jgi:isopenicillin-N N-acyltransferase-like protein
MELEVKVPSNFIHTEPIPIIKVKGTHKEIGRQIGEAFREQITHHIQNTRELINTTFESLELDWDGARMQGRKYIPFAEERFPEYVDELCGLSEGANVDFDDVGVVNALEAVTIDALHLSKCTSVAISETRTADGHVLIGHNEDWIPEDEPDVYLIHAEPNDDPPFLAMTYGALLPNIGFNAYGIAQCCDSVYPNDSRIGIPRLVVSRAILAARTPSEAIRQTLIPLLDITTCSPMKAEKFTAWKFPPGSLVYCMLRMVTWSTRTITLIPICRVLSMSLTSLFPHGCATSELTAY